MLEAAAAPSVNELQTLALTTKTVVRGQAGTHFRVLTTLNNIRRVILHGYIEEYVHTDNVTGTLNTDAAEDFFQIQESALRKFNFPNQSGGTVKVRFTIFELTLNYRSVVIRYQLRPLKYQQGADIEARVRHARTILSKLYELMRMEKQRQMTLPQHEWPDLHPNTWTPGSVAQVDDMPIVIWLNTERTKP